jgi:putative membrane protein
MDNPEPDHEDLKLSDKLAIERTILAADRSLLAWLRTSLSLIGFGFTIYKFLQYMLQQKGPELLLREQTPRNIGLFLVVIGTIPLLFEIVAYTRTLKRLHQRVDVEAPKLYWNPNFLAACAICLLGCLLLIALVFRIRVL